MIRNVLLSAIVLASLVASSPPASAQSAEPSEFGTEAIDTDQGTDRVGLVDSSQGVWHLRGENGVVNSFFYGNPGDVPFVGDWNCDGIDTPGLYRQSDGFVYLRNSNTQGVADIRFFFGNPGDFPLAGDFNNDGCDTVSIYRPSESRIYVINALGANDGGLGAADFSYIFGNPGDKPFVGDFNGDGVDTVGLHRESTGFVYFRQSHTQGIADSEFFFGDPGDRLVAGDWGVIDDVDSPAIFRPGTSTFYFRYTNTQGVADETMPFGLAPWLPVAGQWAPNLGINGTLPGAVVNIPFSVQLSVVGAVPPFTVQKIGGPAWVNVSATGLVQGTPSASDTGSFFLDLKVTDLRGFTAIASFPLNVTDGCAGNTTLPAAQCLALVDIYRQAGGNGWIDKTGWLTGNPCTSWFGVTCTGANVSGLLLEENNLTGTISSQIGMLTGLTTIDLHANLLAGQLPAQMSALTALTSLRLDSNQLNGELSSALILAWPSLITLDLSANAFSGDLPTEMNETNLPALTFLALDENGFGPAFPEHLGTLTGLQTLHLNENLFAGDISASTIWDLTSLTSLDLAENEGLSGTLPADINTLTNLTSLDVSETAMGGVVPDAISSMTQLSQLFLFGTPPCFTSVNQTTIDFVFARDPLWNTC